ncbi:MAG: hypothetical protein LBC97_12960 [Bifidobacteriaceae bacterium]|jgi:hypothetical protein|nr:hypothetical protein [Bifidobacteriaceae bacterium]
MHRAARATRRLRRFRSDFQPEAAALARQAEAADGDDLGTVVVARAVLAQAAAAEPALEKAARRERRSALRRPFGQAAPARAVGGPRERREDRRWLADQLVALSAMALVATVAVPGWVGKYLLRDTFLFPAALSAPPGMRDAMRSGAGEPLGALTLRLEGPSSYLLPHFLAGTLLIVAVAACFVLFTPPWRGRRAHLLAAGAVLAACILGYPTALAVWTDREATVEAVGVAPPDFRIAPAVGEGGVLWLRENDVSACGLAVAANPATGEARNYIDLGDHRYYVWTAAVSADSASAHAYTCAGGWEIGQEAGQEPGQEDGQARVGSQAEALKARWNRYAGGQRLLAYRDGERLTSVSLDGGIVGRGSLCDTDGTPEGLLWWSRGVERSEPGSNSPAGEERAQAAETPANLGVADEVAMFSLAGPAEQTAQFTTLADFTAKYQMCAGDGPGNG